MVLCRLKEKIHPMRPDFWIVGEQPATNMANLLLDYVYSSQPLSTTESEQSCHVTDIHAEIIKFKKCAVKQKKLTHKSVPLLKQ